MMKISVLRKVRIIALRRKGPSRIPVSFGRQIFVSYRTQLAQVIAMNNFQWSSQQSAFSEIPTLSLAKGRDPFHRNALWDMHFCHQERTAPARMAIYR
jgi:hypothetical protein